MHKCSRRVAWPDSHEIRQSALDRASMFHAFKIFRVASMTVGQRSRLSLGVCHSGKSLASVLYGLSFSALLLIVLTIEKEALV